MSLRLWGRLGGLLLLIGFVSALGCGTKAKGVVKGQVTFNGKPLTAGNVIFTTKDNRSATATIDPSGNYTANDAPVGDCTVIVTVPKPMMTMPGMGAPKPPKGIPEMKPPGGGEGGTGPPPMVDPSKLVQIPEKYTKAETSGLSLKVVKGEQTFNITLTP
jgi:hypothetical protein